MAPLNSLAPETCLGIQFDYRSGQTRCSMSAFIEKALDSAGMTDCNPVRSPMTEGFKLHSGMGPSSDKERQEIIIAVNKTFGGAIRKRFGHPISTWGEVQQLYSSLVSTVGWIQKQIAPVLSLAHSILGRAMHNPCIEAFNAVKRVYRFLKGNTDLALVFPHTKAYRFGITYPEFHMQSDASFADDLSTRKSQGGFLGRIDKMAPCYWSSSKTARLCTSTTHAETAHASKACKHIIYVRNLLRFLQMLAPGPTLLELDSLSTVSTSGAPIRKFSPNAKHFHIDELFIVQAVEDLDAHVTHVSGSVTDNNPEGFPVDAMTKPLSFQLIDHYRFALQGDRVYSRK